MQAKAKAAPSYDVLEGASYAKFKANNDNDTQFLAALLRLFEYGGKAYIKDQQGTLVEYTVGSGEEIGEGVTE